MKGHTEMHGEHRGQILCPLFDHVCSQMAKANRSSSMKPRLDGKFATVIINNGNPCHYHNKPVVIRKNLIITQ